MDGMEAARGIIAHASTDLCLDLRFMTRAVLSFRTEVMEGDGPYSCKGYSLTFHSEKVISDFKEDPNRISRAIAHMILHSVLGHIDVNIDPMEGLAEDMTVEYSLDMFDTPHISTPGREDRIFAYERMLKKSGSPAIGALASELRSASEWQIHSYHELFFVDSHESRDGSYPPGLPEIAEQMMVEIEGFSMNMGDRTEALLRVLRIRNRKRYDHRAFLRKFMTAREGVKENPDEFDPAYYSYGMSLYGNIPLIDSTEYSDRRSIEDLAIAIDTSGSTMKGPVIAFIEEVRSIMEQCGIDKKTNLHIIQCDELVRSDTVIHNRHDMDSFIEDLELHGGKGTDFRPVFQYLDSLIEEGVFTSLKGLLYFTDGMGIYPVQKPSYRTAFVFCDDGASECEVPAWAMKVQIGLGELANPNNTEQADDEDR